MAETIVRFIGALIQAAFERGMSNSAGGMSCRIILRELTKSVGHLFVCGSVK